MIAVIGRGITSEGQNHVMPKLRSSVREFEAMLIADLLKTANDMEPSEGAGMQGYDDMRTQAIATAMAGQGGIGVGKLLLKQLDNREGEEH